MQAIGASSPEWAQSLPDNLRALEASGLVKDQKSLKRLRDGAELIEAGTDLSPAKACSLFSAMLELQGQPRGTPWIVTVVPTREDPQGVAGQMCSGGRFTSVLVANQEGLVEPLPVEQVAKALKSAHRNNAG